MLLGEAGNKGRPGFVRLEIENVLAENSKWKAGAPPLSLLVLQGPAKAGDHGVFVLILLYDSFLLYLPSLCAKTTRLLHSNCLESIYIVASDLIV